MIATRNTRNMSLESPDNHFRGDEAAFRALVDNLPQLVWAADGTGAICWLNRRWFEYTSATIEASLGWAWLEFVHPDQAGRVSTTWRNSCAAGTPWEETFPLRGADGTYRWFISRAIPARDNDGLVLTWYGTITDVNSRVDSENELRVAAGRRDALLAWLGHELRNPLTPILTASHLLTLLEPGDPRLQSSKDTITRQALQLSNLVDNLLDAGRISLGKLRVLKTRVEMTPLIMQAVEACQVNIAQRHHSLELALPQRPVFVEADGTRIVQLISNLVNNAAKYMHEGGAIRVEVEQQCESVVVRVRDQGIGIAADVLSRVFDPYVQVGVGPLHAHGLGIGLTLVKAIAEAHGGTVEARSEGRNRGSEFVVRLPLMEPHAPLATS